MKKFIYNLTILFLSTIFFSACNHYEPIFKPEFKVSNDLVYSNIQTLTKVKNIHIEGYKTRVDDTLDISLNVQLINPEELSTSEDSILFIQKAVASKIKNLLKNPSQFKAYNIHFIRRDTVKGIMGTMTTEKGISHHRFNFDEL